jgi:hypothetical protein
MAEKHESNPSLQTSGDFRKRVEVGSASSWTAFNLKLFRAIYEKDDYDELPPAVYEYGVMDPVLQQRNTP